MVAVDSSDLWAQRRKHVMWWLHTHERRPAKFSRGVQAGRRCLRAAVLRVAAVLVRWVAHVKRGGLGFLIPFHSWLVRVEPCAHTHPFRFASVGGGIQRTSGVARFSSCVRALGSLSGEKARGEESGRLCT